MGKQEGERGWHDPEKQEACTQGCSPAHSEAHLCVASSGLLYQGPRHGAAHREALEEAPNEVAETEGHQLLLRRAQV